MLKSLYCSKVMFQCASTWLFNFWACDLQFIGSSGTVSIIFWRSSPPTNSNWLLMEICTPQFLWKYSTALKLIKLVRGTHQHPSSCSLKSISLQLPCFLALTQLFFQICGAHDCLNTGQHSCFSSVWVIFFLLSFIWHCILFLLPI